MLNLYACKEKKNRAQYEWQSLTFVMRDRNQNKTPIAPSMHPMNELEPYEEGVENEGRVMTNEMFRLDG